MRPQVLVPYDKREGMTLRAAAELAGKSEGYLSDRPVAFVLEHVDRFCFRPGFRVGVRRARPPL